MFSYIDPVVFWKLAYWLAHKYRESIKQLMRMWCKRGLTLSGTQTHVKQCFLPLTPLLMAANVLLSPVLPV